jgi:hypothetical protein
LREVYSGEEHSLTVSNYKLTNTILSDVNVAWSNLKNEIAVLITFKLACKALKADFLIYALKEDSLTLPILVEPSDASKMNILIAKLRGKGIPIYTGLFEQSTNVFKVVTDGSTFALTFENSHFKENPVITCSNVAQSSKIAFCIDKPLDEVTFNIKRFKVIRIAEVKFLNTSLLFFFLNNQLPIDSAVKVFGKNDIHEKSQEYFHTVAFYKDFVLLNIRNHGVKGVPINEPFKDKLLKSCLKYPGNDYICKLKYGEGNDFVSNIRFIEKENFYYWVVLEWNNKEIVEFRLISRTNAESALTYKKTLCKALTKFKVDMNLMKEHIFIEIGITLRFTDGIKVYFYPSTILIKDKPTGKNKNLLDA